ncbi:zinc ribbon domain-containing protein [Ligilactobacillus equi]|uniref:zinc ribbon domain-containing protein n=1 Tax=Ligilactobacillus equi TaxID=137357 RepID=UPI0006863B4C|nr:zinc ribbon domain-containing protein [Ligilactobacillus equi]
MNNKFCIHCGNQIIPGAKFCSACGQPVVEDRQVNPNQVNGSMPNQNFGSNPNDYHQGRCQLIRLIASVVLLPRQKNTMKKQNANIAMLQTKNLDLLVVLNTIWFIG